MQRRTFLVTIAASGFNSNSITASPVENETNENMQTPLSLTCMTQSNCATPVFYVDLAIEHRHTSSHEVILRRQLLGDPLGLKQWSIQLHNPSYGQPPAWFTGPWPDGTYRVQVKFPHGDWSEPEHVTIQANQVIQTAA